MEEGIKYAQEALKNGQTIEQVRQTFRETGWQDSQLDELFARIAQEVKPQESSSTPVPSNTENAEEKEAVLPTDELELKTKSLTKFYIGLIFFVLLLVGSTVAYYYGVFDSFFSKGENPTEITTSGDTNIYSGSGLTFSYPKDWKQRDGSWITTGDIQSEITAKSTDINRYFFKSQDLTDLDAAIAALPPSEAGNGDTASNQSVSGAIALLSETIYKSPLIVVYNLTDTSPGDEQAKNFVIENLKTVFGKNGESTYDINTVVDPARINSTTVDGHSAYWATNGPEEHPYIVVGLPLKTGSAGLIFNGATSLSKLASDQLAVYDSIKIP